ncbi:hypothetical protein ACHAW5_006487 [Stephanodiscus triporus]|uniref:Uncharacterized protein n=1 Tax=Stephanodiscus triporus TaxID=2934178 RepID=A0ABD3MGR2_9STRA
MSIVALRLRYGSTRDDDDDATTTTRSSSSWSSWSSSSSCLIDTLVGSVRAVAGECARGHDGDDRDGRIRRAHGRAAARSIASCMTALPEAVLLTPMASSSSSSSSRDDGGGGGRRAPSAGPACLRAASRELRRVGTGRGGIDDGVGTGMDRAWNALLSSYADYRRDGDDDDDSVNARLLGFCDSWARHVAVPMKLVDVTVGSLASAYLRVEDESSSSGTDRRARGRERARAAAYQYLVSIFESASPSLTPEDVLAAALGVAGGGGGGGAGGGAGKNTSTRRRRGNKAKRRQEERLGGAASSHGGGLDAAEAELVARRNAACVAAAAAFGVSLADGSTAAEDRGLRHAATSSPRASTHGMCATAASAAASILPHLLYLERGDVVIDGETDRRWRLELFSAIATVLRRICASRRDIRVLAYEPLMILSASLSSVAVVSSEMERVAVDAICECVLSLAASCGYPLGYFDQLFDNNDEELEIERNDVRDVARSVCSLDRDCDIRIWDNASPSMLILERIVGACNTAIREAASVGHLPPETAVHILSALAKPLNKLGKVYRQQPSAFVCSIITMSMLALGSVCDQLNSSFDSRSISQMLPLSRLACMAVASLSPMLSSMAELIRVPSASDTDKEFPVTLICSIRCYLQHSILSTARIPELVAESTLKATRYDIKGAMRGSGGEDHVGCIALMRLSHESDELIDAIFEGYSAILHDLSSLHQGLKISELQRGVSVNYGLGVCPVSRRIILRVISRLAIYQMKVTKDEIGDGRAILHRLALAPLDEMKSLKDAPLSPEKLFRVCESAYDLSFFSPEVLADVFNNPLVLEVLFDCAIEGYSRLLVSSDVDALCHQVPKWDPVFSSIVSWVRKWLMLEFI